MRAEVQAGVRMEDRLRGLVNEDRCSIIVMGRQSLVKPGIIWKSVACEQEDGCLTSHV
jgi:hypothetical protein